MAKLCIKKAVMMSETKIAELEKAQADLEKGQAILETHLKSHGSQLESLIDSTKELNKTVVDQQSTIIKQVMNTENAVEKMTKAIELQEQTQKEVHSVREFVEGVDKRVLRIEEKIKHSDAFWAPFKKSVVGIVVGFIGAGIIWAAVKAFNGG